MVHALEQIYGLIKPFDEVQGEPGGYLIDIHPDGDLVEFILPVDGSEHFIGYMYETDDYIEYRQADETIETVILDGLFEIEKTGEFEFRTYANSIEELKAFLDENWSDAVVTDEVIASAKKLEREHNQHKLFLREQVSISLLIRQNKKS